jgi:hypothetical protein
MDRTPSEWEREFQAQQMAAMNEDLSTRRRSSGNSVAEANRTPSDWMKAFERERETVMGASSTPAQGVLPHEHAADTQKKEQLYSTRAHHLSQEHQASPYN